MRLFWLLLAIPFTTPTAPTRTVAPRLVVTVPRDTVCVGDSITGVSAIPYDTRGRVSTSSTISWRTRPQGYLAVAKRDGHWQHVALIGMQPSSVVVVAATWSRSDGLVLTDSARVTVLAQCGLLPPKDTTVAPAPAPVDTTNLVTLASHSFEDGTFGPFTNPWDADIDVIADPTNSGHGKVARMHYAGTAQDKNRALQFEYGQGISLGQSIQFDGDLYLPASITDTSTSGAQRKLLYWQPDPASPYLAAVVHLFGTAVSTDFLVARPTGVQEVVGGCPMPGCFLTRGVWHHITLLVRINSTLGAIDGLFRLTIDGVVRSEKVGASWSDASWTASPKLRYFLVGEQVNSSGTFDEVRYWDNLRFSVPKL